MATLYEKSCKVYDYMVANSIEDEQGSKYYIGFLSKECMETLEMQPKYYSRVVSRLKESGSIERLSAGYRGVPGRWLIVQPPNPAAFGTGNRRVLGGTGAPRATSRMVIEQQVRDLTTMVNDLKNRLTIQEGKFNLLVDTLNLPRSLSIEPTHSYEVDHSDEEDNEDSNYSDDDDDDNDDSDITDSNNIDDGEQLSIDDILNSIKAGKE